MEVLEGRGGGICFGLILHSYKKNTKELSQRLTICRTILKANLREPLQCNTNIKFLTEYKYEYIPIYITKLTKFNFDCVKTH